MITDEQQRKLQELNETFLEENTKLNLSAFRTPEACWVGNVMDSLPFLDSPFLSNIDYPLSIIDIGTGGGFPLLPLAICLPDAKLTGLDSTQKKIDAIQRIVDRLALSNVHLLCGRTEELGRDTAHREQYDIVTARAVAPLNVLLEFASPFVKPGGRVVAWKSVHMEKEMEESLLARAELSCQLVDQYEYDLCEEWGKRQLLIFEKRAVVSDTYPRAVGVPKKNPLV